MYKTRQSTGPDLIKPLSLNKLHSEVAAILQIIFFSKKEGRDQESIQ